jgi:hypothetical protein
MRRFRSRVAPNIFTMEVANHHAERDVHYRDPILVTSHESTLQSVCHVDEMMEQGLAERQEAVTNSVDTRGPDRRHLSFLSLSG